MKQLLTSKKLQNNFTARYTFGLLLLLLLFALIITIIIVIS